MRKTYKNVELDYGYLYPEVAEGVRFVADVEVEIDENGEKVVVGAWAKESNEVFGVKAGDYFDPGDSINPDFLE